MHLLDACSSDDLRSFLRDTGYTVLERENVWHECLVLGHGERWTGLGASARDALADAVVRLFPSHAAQRSLLAALARRAAVIPLAPRPVPVDAPGREAPARVAGDAAQPVEAPASAAQGGSKTEDAERADETTAPAMPPAAAQEAVEAAPPPDAPAQETPPAETPSRDTPAETVRAVVIGSVPLAVVAAANADETLAELADLRERMAAQRGELALSTPLRQRLVLLGWLAQIRACQGEAAASIAVRNLAAELVAELRALSERWWPGVIAVLAKDTRPADARKDLRGYGPMVLLTWRDVMQAARDSLEEAEADDLADDRDAWGWADAARLVPPPKDAEALLADVRAELEEHGGDVMGRQPKYRPVPPAELLVGWSQRVRWLRGTIDPEVWAACIGRLRFWSQWSGGCTAAREALDPTWVPSRSWEALVRSAAEESREAAELAEVLAAVPAPDAGECALVDWLARALPLTSNHQRAIAEAAAPLRDRIHAVGEAQLPNADRRIRRRLQKLKDALAEPEAPAQAPEPARPQAVPAAAPAPGDDIPESVIACTRGRTVLFVSNRADKDLEKLLERFRFGQLEWKESSPRRIAHAVEAIKPGRFDIVLGATGFLDHAADGLLAKACRSAGTAYVRVERGRPGKVLQALERDLAGNRG